MSLQEIRPAKASSLENLNGAVRKWVERGDPRALRAWLDRELDGEGAPRNLAVPDWLACLEIITEGCNERPEGWPEDFDARLEGFVATLLRFSRPDGRPLFGPTGQAPTPRRTRELLRAWAERLSEPGLNTVVDWWFPPKNRPRGRHAPPPLPAWMPPDRVRAALRSDWSKAGGFLAVDHRDRVGSSALEFFGLGKTWLGPTWVSGDAGPGEAGGRARPVHWASQSTADIAEWTFTVGGRRVIRTAVLLRGRQLALLADQVEGGGSEASMTIGLPESVNAEPMPECRAMALGAGRGGSPVRILPVALPHRPYETDRGSLVADREHGLVLRQRSEERRQWLPLLVSWDALRSRRKVDWRVLTVSEGSRTCPASTAFAARVSWGRGETLVIYRSLGRPALRSFLGHQTRARFLIGHFTSQGDVEPILKVEP